ncbi:G-protein coupled receptor moody-like [Argonauta hians]
MAITDIFEPDIDEDFMPIPRLKLPYPTPMSYYPQSTSDQVIAIISVVIIGIIMVTGIIGNALVIIAVKKYKNLQTFANAFIVNLSVVNLLFDLLVLPVHAYTNINQADGLSPSLCKLVAFADYALTGTSILTIILIAFNRHTLVADYNNYTLYFSSGTVTVLLGSAWILPMIWLIPPLLEIWGKLGYVERLSTCNLFEDLQYFKDTVLVLRTVMPAIIIVYFYVGICKATRASSKRISSQNRYREKKERHMTKVVLLTITLFFIFYFPCTATALIDLYYTLSKPYHIFCRLCIYCSTALNPIIYGVSNTQFTEAFKKLFSCQSNIPHSNIPVLAIFQVDNLSPNQTGVFQFVRPMPNETLRKLKPFRYNPNRGLLHTTV